MAAKSYKVLAFDTGERTGWALARVMPYYKPTTKRFFVLLDQGVWAVDQVMGKLPDLIAQTDVVVYEAWRLYETHAMAMIGNDMQPSQVVGMVRYEGHRQGKKVRSQGALLKTPATATMRPDLREHMAKSSEQHDQDAIMHAWFYAFNRYYEVQEANKK